MASLPSLSRTGRRRATPGGCCCTCATSIPGADLQASWGQAATYLEFRGNQPPDGPGLRALPPVADFPLAETCESCRVDARDRSSEMCADCTARAAVAGHRRARPRPGRQETAGQEVDALGTERAGHRRGQPGSRP